MIAWVEAKVESRFRVICIERDPFCMPVGKRVNPRKKLRWIIELF
jgi:hypothetical protein